MYIGHVGAALAAKRARASVGLVVLLVATYTPDWVDAGLCLSGVDNPGGVFSHSVPAIALFALIGFAAYVLRTRDLTGGILVGAVIVSHMLLDWITGHKPTWPGGPMIGLGLYGYPVADFIVEGVLIAIGAFLWGRSLPRRQRGWVDVSIMTAALLALQLGIDVAHMLLKTLTKC
jgi:hypothetical protein